MMTRAAFLELMYDRSVLQSLLFTTSPSDIFHVSTQTAKICKGCRFPLQWRFDSVGNIIIAVGFFARFIYASTEINKPGLDYHRINKPTVFFFLSHSLCPSSFVFFCFIIKIKDILLVITGMGEFWNWFQFTYQIVIMITSFMCVFIYDWKIVVTTYDRSIRFIVLMGESHKPIWTG